MHYTQQELQSLYWKISGAWQGNGEKIPTQKALESLNTILKHTTLGSPLHVQAHDLKRDIIRGATQSPETQATTATILTFPLKKSAKVKQQQ